MKTFEEIYNDLQNNNSAEYNEAFNDLKEKKQKAKKISLTICLIGDLLFVIFAIIIISNLKGFGTLFFVMPAIMVAIIFNVLTYVIVYVCVGGSKQHSKFNSLYKNKIIQTLIANFYDNLEYFPNKEMPEYIYEKLDYEDYDTYESDDYFEALIDNKYSIQMAEIKTERIVETDDYNLNNQNRYRTPYEKQFARYNVDHSNTRYITEFHGLFSKIVIDKSINSTLEITPNRIISLDSNKLNMDSSEFEKYFDVSASNKIIGMQLLTSDVMQDLVDFKIKTNMQYEIKIINNEIYIRFHSGEMFEAENINNSLNKAEIEKYFYMLNFTYNLSKKLIDVINQTQI